MNDFQGIWMNLILMEAKENLIIAIPFCSFCRRMRTTREPTRFFCFWSFLECLKESLRRNPPTLSRGWTIIGRSPVIPRQRHIVGCGQTAERGSDSPWRGFLFNSGRGPRSTSKEGNAARVSCEEMGELPGSSRRIFRERILGSYAFHQRLTFSGPLSSVLLGNRQRK